jgi:tRNA A37 methylthiotransferase MiaB
MIEGKLHIRFVDSLSVYGGLPPEDTTHNTPGFRTIYKAKVGGVRFADLLHQVSELDPEVRIRFTSPHPKDFPSEVLDVIAEKSNICKQIHLPAQSGSSKILEAMRRGYTREAYLELVHHMREKIPDVILSTDLIAGFCGETEEDFEQTLSLMEQVRYTKLFMYPYSLREVGKPQFYLH